MESSICSIKTTKQCCVCVCVCVKFMSLAKITRDLLLDGILVTEAQV
jgi:hypothetical protein